MMQKFRINPNGAFSRFIFFVVAFTTLSSMLTYNTLHIERIDYLENNIPDIHRIMGSIIYRYSLCCHLYLEW